ncbi:methyltransferase domain-containing protein [Actinokineospora diospyrosa]|uniref:Protein arginine N-methyltransferase 1 n=1 Tax=Actinokineospora diospyrosa TaxID=103728 RepID=A0ABT1I5F4_9PSEU|nr:methyltransferase domain-containing protein [Actinokineospora diospyrosa]MCP2267842.1 protein arginine N-methyltransferase 1 [Actinokineospora diospyrosa]
MSQTYSAEEVWLPASELIADWDSGFHDLLLGDRLRMSAYAEAIAEVVRPGATVLDLGTGTGILARWALEAGASRVYGLDFAETVLATAAARLAEAGFGDRFVPVAGLSFDVALPERVDVIISETLGNLVDNEGCGTILADARRRFLADGGVVLPISAQCYLAPVAALTAHGRVAAGEVHGARAVAGSDLGLAARDPFTLYYDTIIPIATHLASPRAVTTHTFGDEPISPASVSTPYTVRRDGVFTGFKGYFVSTLSPSIALDLSGDDIDAGSTSDSWKHAYLPVREPVEVRQGDRLVLDFGWTPRGSLGNDYRWSGRVLRRGEVVATFDHGTASLVGGAA